MQVRWVSSLVAKPSLRVGTQPGVYTSAFPVIANVERVLDGIELVLHV